MLCSSSFTPRSTKNNRYNLTLARLLFLLVTVVGTSCALNRQPNRLLAFAKQHRQSPRRQGSAMPSQSPGDSSEGLVLSLSQHLGPQGSDNDIHLILASQSPRRREILDMMGLPGKFTPTPSPLDESALQKQLKDQSPVDYTRRLAEEKAKALAVDIVDSATKLTLVLGSDTIVDLDGKILEKPTDEKQAKKMLVRLSGRKHFVHTGVAVYHVAPASREVQAPSLVASFTDTAEVCFAELSEKDIDSYVATKEPMDKAGSYGIQGIGGQFVRNVSGDFFTVMGLPMHRTSMLLAKAISEVIKSKREAD